MAVITLENMEFYAYHGCMEHEKQLGNIFYVTVSLNLNTKEAGISDSLNDTLNYQHIYDIVDREMRIPANLIEHLSYRILSKLVEKFPAVEFTVNLTKINPPLGGKTNNVTIQLSSTEL